MTRLTRITSTVLATGAMLLASAIAPATSRSMGGGSHVGNRFCFAIDGVPHELQSERPSRAEEENRQAEWCLLSLLRKDGRCVPHRSVLRLQLQSRLRVVLPGALAVTTCVQDHQRRRSHHEYDHQPRHRAAIVPPFGIMGAKWLASLLKGGQPSGDTRRRLTRLDLLEIAGKRGDAMYEDDLSAGRRRP
jgi:hypothetical protein